MRQSSVQSLSQTGIALTLLISAMVSLLLGCSDVSTPLVYGPAGKAGEHTPVLRDTQGNSLGYYEYLPENFAPDIKYPLVIYWNGQNTIRGDGRTNIGRLLFQGLPKNINEGAHYPVIVISGMVDHWRDTDIHPFVEYIAARYAKQINPGKIYMSGFSAGGGMTMRYARDYPKLIAAIVPVSPSIREPGNGEPSKEMAAIPSWFFHNKGDTVVDPENTQMWHDALLKKGGDHRLTLYDSTSHYAWQQAYQEKEMWQWLVSQEKSLP